MCLLVIKKPSPTSGEDDDGISANTVKKVIILADVPNVPENYHNILELWREIGLHNLKFITACDHKMANIICGIQVNLQHWRILCQ